MKEGVTVFEPMSEGSDVLEFNTYPIDEAVVSVADFHHIANGLKERGFIKRHGKFMRWYPPRVILNVTWKIQKGPSLPSEAVLAVIEQLENALWDIRSGGSTRGALLWLQGKLSRWLDDEG